MLIPLPSWPNSANTHELASHFSPATSASGDLTVMLDEELIPYMPGRGGQQYPVGGAQSEVSGTSQCKNRGH